MCVSSCARPAPSGATRPRKRFFAPFRSPFGTSLQGAKSANPPAPPSLGRSLPPFHFGRPRPRSRAPPKGGLPCTFAIFGSRYVLAVGQPCRSLLDSSRYDMAAVLIINLNGGYFILITQVLKFAVFSYLEMLKLSCLFSLFYFSASSSVILPFLSKSILIYIFAVSYF